MPQCNVMLNCIVC